MHQKSKEAAALAASVIAKAFNIDNDINLALQLGTGWGKIFEWEKELPFQEIPGFERLGELPGHARKLALGSVGGRPVLALRGRVHINEAPADPNIHAMVRLQVEMLQELGVETLIATCATGSLVPQFQVGSVVVVDGFITLFAPEMPMFVAEFDSPEDTLKEELIKTAIKEAGSGLRVHRGTHVMLRGPFFEGRRLDKRILADLGGKVVGMSLLPEACIMATRKQRLLGLCFVSNNATETHSDEEIGRRVSASSALLGQYLNRIVAAIE